MRKTDRQEYALRQQENKNQPLLWHSVEGYLQQQLPRADYETWVKAIRLLRWTETEVIIQCVNEYGQKWCTEHLTDMIQAHLLAQYQFRGMVRFIVGEISTVEEKRELISQSQNEMEAMNLEVRYPSIYQQIIQPERVVRFPVYLFRWLPYVGAQTIFIVLALWQEYYLAQNQAVGNPGKQVSVRAERVCQWAGISRAQYFRILKTNNHLSWFMQKMDTRHEMDQQSGKIKKSANQYQLYDLPLTPGDAEDLRNYLITNQIDQFPEKVLQKTIQCPPKEILRYPYRLPSEEFATQQPQYFTVQQIVQELIGKPLNKKISALVNQLAMRLQTPDRFQMVSWYFLQHWLPTLGADAAMFILLLRNLSYFNEQMGEVRNELWIHGGYEEIANWLGIQNKRLVTYWFPAARTKKINTGTWSEKSKQEMNRREQLQEKMAFFIQRLDYRISRQGHYAWKYNVQRMDPLLPEHQRVEESIQILVSSIQSQHLEIEFEGWLTSIPNDCFETHKNDRTIELRLSDALNDCSETLKPVLKDCFETLENVSNDCFETVLKILKSIKDTYKQKIPTSREDAEIKTMDCDQGGWIKHGQSMWSLPDLLGRANQKNRTLLLKQEKSAIPFMAWIIYGFSKPSIVDPYSLAIAKLKQTPGCLPGGPADRLAQAPSEVLVRMLDQVEQFIEPNNSDWRQLFSNIKLERIRMLRDLLSISKIE